MVGWHHQLNGHEFGQTLGDSEGQGSLVCCSPGVAKSQKQLSNRKQKQMVNMVDKKLPVHRGIPWQSRG